MAEKTLVDHEKRKCGVWIKEQQTLKRPTMIQPPDRQTSWITTCLLQQVVINCLSFQTMLNSVPHSATGVQLSNSVLTAVAVARN